MHEAGGGGWSGCFLLSTTDEAKTAYPDNPDDREREENRVEPTPSDVVERIAEAVEIILG